MATEMIKRIVDVEQTSVGEGVNLLVNDNGRVKQMPASKLGARVDTTLTQEGAAADAKATGDRLSKLSKEIDNIHVEAHLTEFEQSGINAVVYSVKGSNLELSAELLATQSGVGIPAPDNVRPINSFDVLTFTRTEDGAEIEVNLGETVYGGTVDLQTGIMTINRAVITVSDKGPVGSVNKDASDATTILYQMRISEKTDVSQRALDICDLLPNVLVHAPTFPDATAQSKYGKPCFSFHASPDYSDYLYIRLDKAWLTGDTFEDVQAWLAENPLTITYGLVEPRIVQLDPQVFKAIDGKNTIKTNANTLTVKGVDQPIGRTVMEQLTAAKKIDMVLPELALYGDVSGMDKDNEVTLDYAYKDRTGTLTCKWQGSSSLSYDKKNYTIKFDEAFEVVEGWGVQKKYCLKANWIDASHARNVVSAKLWGQVVASRTPSNATLAACPNYGAVDGFPIVVTLNGEFMGLYTFNIPKDKWMMDMGNGTSEAILCADKHVAATQFKAAAVCDGSDFELEYVTDEDDAAWAVTSVNRMINACINSDGTDLDTTIAQYIDIESAIDYMIFVSLLDGHDMADKNYLLSTYDGTKWFFGGYDMDCTYGLWWDGSYFLPATNWQRNFYWWANKNRLMELLYNNKRAKIKERYLALRSGALSDDNVITTFTNFIGLIPANVYRAEQERWPEIPNTSANTLPQITDWYCRRAAYIDKEVNGWT